MTTSIATDTWYQGKQYYDFDKGEVITDDDLSDEENDLREQNAYYFTQMLWKDSTEVGLGVKGKWVVGWFCEDKGNDPETAQAFVDNVNDVCMVTGEEPTANDATAKKYNRCYNDMARDYHNSKRAIHKQTEPLETDINIAKFIQDKLDNYADFDTAF
jgi:hypothetical protein